MHVLEYRRFIKRDGGVLGDGLARIIREYSKMHAQLTLPCIYTPLYNTPFLLSSVRIARGKYVLLIIQSY